ncbi:hypothetical protein WN55_06320 [Dufourea novaeangliae]|uniref:Uncharacterized protein n=1 Tax=Dufourea novaeangliae TaxID=178035 RepID=A0A154PQC3_DUFNO|nr:hypothetical protein WN55_06320 [Dufourea novaeangliae]
MFNKCALWTYISFCLPGWWTLTPLIMIYPRLVVVVIFVARAMGTRGGTMLPPPPVAIFPPAAAMLPRGPPQFAAPYPPPIFYWPYPSPPVSPTNYYNTANVGGIAAIPQQAALLTPAECLQLAPGATVPGATTPTGEPRIEAFLPRMELEKRVPVPAPPQAECSPFVEVFMV